MARKQPKTAPAQPLIVDMEDVIQLMQDMWTPAAVCGRTGMRLEISLRGTLRVRDGHRGAIVLYEGQGVQEAVHRFNRAQKEQTHALPEFPDSWTNTK